MCPLGEIAYTYIVLWWKELVLVVEVSRLRKFLSWIAVIGEHSGRIKHVLPFVPGIASRRFAGTTNV